MQVDGTLNKLSTVCSQDLFLMLFLVFFFWVILYHILEDGEIKITVPMASYVNDLV